MPRSRLRNWHRSLVILTFCCASSHGLAEEKYNFHLDSGPQTPLAQLVARTSGLAQRLIALGPPHYVVRKGHLTGIAVYDEMLKLKEAIAAAFWSNGSCLPAMALFQLDQNGSSEVATVEAGGTICMKDGSPYPTPATNFACAQGAATDPLCNLNWVLTNVTIPE